MEEGKYTINSLVFVIDFLTPTFPYQLHDAYTESSGDAPKTSSRYAEHEEDDELMPREFNSGRLIERLYNFDVRTDKMGDEWYIKFADVRRGSFLPRSGTRKSVAETSEQNEQAPKKRGRTPKNRTSWQNLHPSSVIFLHWVGFDPMSALSPPNEETTQALGYLAYDFFGKIVEKVRCNVTLKISVIKLFTIYHLRRRYHYTWKTIQVITVVLRQDVLTVLCLNLLEKINSI